MPVVSSFPAFFRLGVNVFVVVNDVRRLKENLNDDAHCMPPQPYSKALYSPTYTRTNG